LQCIFVPDRSAGGTIAWWCGEELTRFYRNNKTLFNECRLVEGMNKKLTADLPVGRQGTAKKCDFSCSAAQFDRLTASLCVNSAHSSTGLLVCASRQACL